MMNDYFSKRMGFVIDDTPMSRNAAFSYLVNVCGMDEDEADVCLNRLYREYLSRVRAAKRLAKEGR